MVKTPKTPTRARAGAGGLPSPSPTPTSRRNRISPRKHTSHAGHSDHHGTSSTSLRSREDTASFTSVLSTASDQLPSIEELLAETRKVKANEIFRSDLQGGFDLESEVFSSSSRMYSLPIEEHDVPHWQRLKEHLDSFLAVDHLEKVVEQQLTSKILETEGLLDKLSHIIHNHTICPLCSRIMVKVFTLSCGHSYCGRCLRAFFESQLSRKLSQLAELKKVPHNIFRSIPRDVQGREELIKNIEALEVSPEEYLTYSCPATDCEVTSPTIPILSYQHGHLNAVMVDALGTRLSQPFDIAADSTPDYFLGLFI